MNSIVHLTYVLILGLLGFLLRSAYRDAAKAQKNSAKAIQDRESILAIVSHELRNPILSIGLNVKLIPLLLTPEEKKDGQTKLPRLLENITYSLTQMERLIRDLLDASRIDMENFTVKAGPADLLELASESLQSLQSLADEKGIRLDFKAEICLPPFSFDTARISQVLLNLLGNAIKFTPAGGQVVLALQRQPGCALLSVCDTGPGIADADRAHVFVRHWQARDTSQLGAGLGLYISQAIVKAHGGAIWVESTPGKGARFHFTLPLSPPAQI